jgi:hypothetical protein
MIDRRRSHRSFMLRSTSSRSICLFRTCSNLNPRNDTALNRAMIPLPPSACSSLIACPHIHVGKVSQPAEPMKVILGTPLSYSAW